MRPLRLKMGRPSLCSRYEWWLVPATSIVWPPRPSAPPTWSEPRRRIGSARELLERRLPPRAPRWRSCCVSWRIPGRLSADFPAAAGVEGLAGAGRCRCGVALGIVFDRGIAAGRDAGVSWAARDDFFAPAAGEVVASSRLAWQRASAMAIRAQLRNRLCRFAFIGSTS
jgi:hypothetical protein